MSIRQGNNIIAGSGTYHPNLFDFKWSDHILNDVQWLRADTFSWQSGLVYEAAYNHLEAEILGKSLSSETIDNITIQFYLADDGHKICPASQETNLVDLYNTTGIAWYYIIDPTNHRFKLPRTKFGFTGLRSGVGNYVEAGLPNVTGDITGSNGSGNSIFKATSGAFTVGGTHTSYGIGTSSGLSDGSNTAVTFDASHSSSIYGNSDTVQPKATEMYLYFFIGNFETSPVNNPIDMLNLIYPVGSIYIGIQTVCPMTAIMSGSTWELVSAGKALWTGDGTNANTTIEAGLPDHNHAINNYGHANDGPSSIFFVENGNNAVTVTTTNASASNPIYGNSDTVQPPAYVVNVWKRTA